MDHHQPAPTLNPKTILVFGATGRQGGAVATALRSRNYAVRAFVRNFDSAGAKALASKGVTLFHGDFSNLASIEAAMAGVHGVFSMQPNAGSPGSGVTVADELRFGKAIADIAVQSGVRHLVYSSASIISQGPTGLDNLDCKIEIENHIRSLDIASTIVRPGTFMDLLTLPGMGLDHGTFSFFLRPDQSAELIAVEDIGNIVATIFGDPDRYAGRTIELAGDVLTGLALQAALTQAADRPITYQRFADALLDQNPFMKHNVDLFDQGCATGNADIAALKREFGNLLGVKDWLTGPGKPLLEAALKAA